jgi:beta-galactosidase
MFFQLRRSLGAYEKFHGAVIDHVGHEHTRVFRECAELGKELKQLGDLLLDSRMTSKVGILFDWDNWWAVELGGGPSVHLKYLEQIQGYYDACYANGIQVDMIHTETDLTRYELVIAPLLYMTKPGYAAKLEQYVQNGGTLVTTFYSGIADMNDKVVPGGYPGELRPLLGIWVEEIDGMFPDQTNQLVLKEEFGSLQGAYPCRLACEVVHLEGAEAIAAFGSDYYQGSPALTRHRFGQGEAWYWATDPSPACKREWVQSLCKQKGIVPFMEAPEGVEVTQREKEGIHFTFLLNHTDQAQRVHIGNETQRELLSGCAVRDEIELPPKQVMILSL